MGQHFILLHGAWHGGWCWDGVIRALEKAGHTAEAPTMPGHQPQDDRSGIRFEDYVNAIAQVLEGQVGPVVLVGHSSAGFLMQAAAPKASEKISQLVFHNAFILPDGKCQFDLVPPEVAEGMTAAANASSDSCVPIDEGFVRGALMADASKETQDALISRLVPQPISLFTTPVNTGEFDALAIPSERYCSAKTMHPFRPVHTWAWRKGWGTIGWLNWRAATRRSLQILRPSRTGSLKSLPRSGFRSEKCGCLPFEKTASCSFEEGAVSQRVDSPRCFRLMNRPRCRSCFAVWVTSQSTTRS
jgi:pimeloyl-ACP methyl ester carboxylesterase